MIEPPPAETTNRLQCVECGRLSKENERGWRASLTAEDDGSEAVAISCGDCAGTEFRGSGSFPHA